MRVEVSKKLAGCLAENTGCHPISGCAFPDRNPRGDFSPLFRYTLAIMLVAIGGAWLFIRIQNRPLVDTEHAALRSVKDHSAAAA